MTEPLEREHDIQKDILEYLNKVHGVLGFWWKNTTVNNRGRKNVTHRGPADIMGVYRGHHFEFEVKSKRGVQSDYQKVHQANVERAGGRYHVVHSVEEVMEVMGR